MNKLGLFVIVIILFGLGIYQYKINAVSSQNDSRESSMPNTSQEPPIIVSPAVEDSVDTVPSQFSCDGRQYCSQMTSREEAEFFIRNCPDTKMDGDRDGIPCENDSRW